MAAQPARLDAYDRIIFRIEIGAAPKTSVAMVNPLLTNFPSEVHCCDVNSRLLNPQ
jgi:hypothetical protein